MLLLSFAVRAALLLAAGGDLEPSFDERGYYHRADAWRQQLSGPEGTDIPQRALAARIYGEGRWPPLHPLLIGFGLLAFDGGPETARWTVLLLSVLTTVVVYGLGRAVAGKGAGLAAALLYALMPSFVAYSHYLWSETTFILVLLLALWLAVESTQRARRRAVLLAAGSGVAAGLALLARAPGLPMVLVLPAWLALQREAGGRRRLAEAAACLALCLTVVAPWTLRLYQQEGEPVPLSTFGGYNVALGNNPWVGEVVGSSWGDPEGKARLQQEIEARSKARGESLDRASYGLALEQMATAPGQILPRALQRLRLLWTPDFFPLRHLMHGIYPPQEPWVVWSVIVATVLSYVLFLALVSRGLLQPELRSRPLLLSVAMAGLALPMLTIGMPRLLMPVLTVLLPVAGAGCLGIRSRPRWLPSLFLASVIVLLTVPAWPKVLSTFLMPSRHYVAVVRPLERWLGSRAELGDQLLLRRTGHSPTPLAVELVSQGASLTDGGRRLVWPPEQSTLLVGVRSWSDSEPVELALVAGDRRWLMLPVAPSGWRRWQPAEVEGVQWQWLGGLPR